jgi:hypothetical protein
LHYFDRYFYESLESYAARFAAGAGRVKGEITPNYAKLGEERIRFVRNVIPNVRLILLMRNPIDRAWSHALHRLVKATGRPFEEIPSRAFVRHFRTENSRMMGDYLRTIDAWTAHFPPEQLYLGFFDQLAADPRALLTDVFCFLGVSTDVDWDRFLLGKVVHRGPGVRITPELRAVLEEIHAPAIERLYERFGDRVASWRVLGSRVL